MRKTSLVWLILFAPGAFTYACGGGGSGDGGTDATTDATNNTDSPTNKDTGTNDAANDVAQNNDASDGGTGGDGSFSIECTKPAECIDGGDLDAAYPPSSGEVCCAKVSTAGSFPNCSISSLATTCTAPGACTEGYSTSKCTTDTFHACAHASECTGQFNKCCTASTDAGAVTFCMDTILITLLKPTCM